MCRPLQKGYELNIAAARGAIVSLRSTSVCSCLFQLYKNSTVAILGLRLVVHAWISSVLILSGDVETNPGPLQFCRKNNVKPSQIPLKRLLINARSLKSQHIQGTEVSNITFIIQLTRVGGQTRAGVATLILV